MERITDSLTKDVNRCVEKYGFVLVLEAIAECAEERAKIADSRPARSRGRPMWWILAARALDGIAKGLRETW